MRVKKYQAIDMPEALRKIREELGPDAVILSTRQVKPGKGVFGMLGRPLLEVTAAADVDPAVVPGVAPRPASAATPTAPPRPAPTPPTRDHGLLLALQADVESFREELAVLARRPSRAPPAEVLVRDVKALADKIDRLVSQSAPLERLRLSPSLRRLHGHLEALDLDPALTGRVLTFLQEKLDAGTVPEGGEVGAFRELVERTVRVSGNLLPEGGAPRVVALVGPTGVGKTTTVAKLAARFGLQQERRVGLITVDTFRIAAVEQLKTYARIMDVPIRVALDVDGFQAAVEEFVDRELVLVDTAGQSPKDEQSLGALLELFPPPASVEVHLVLSVTTRGRDLERILRHYAPLKPTRLLLTKLDETDCHGPLFGLPLASRLPLSYLTTGQNVPDDIEEAAARRVADYLLQGLEAAP